MNLLMREGLLAKTRLSLSRNPVTALVGPRQCGKSTLAHQIAGTQSSVYLDLENPDDDRRLSEPMRELERLSGLVVLDEIQRRPDLLPVLRVLADRRPITTRFLILGSASPDMFKGSSETLAGRIEFVEMSGFDIWETGSDSWRRLWVRGGFPNSFLAASATDSAAWREQFIRTFLERDIPQLGPTIPAQTARNFWTMVAHYHGQVWNGSEIGRSLGVAHTTARRHLDILCGALVVRQLPPWFENAGKRIVKSPKVYMRDTGLLHSLLRLPDEDALAGHPKRGASWEGFALDQVLRLTGDRDAYFWATHGGAELDLLVHWRGRRYGFEFKYGDSPAMTKSMHIAIADLGLERLFVVHPGNSAYVLNERTEAVPLPEVARRWAQVCATPAPTERTN
jgi:predicted AAA+ superfamily ATPase